MNESQPQQQCQHCGYPVEIGEHARVAIGFIGSADNPTKIITMDPIYGEKYFTRSSFEWNWGLLGNSGVVVE
ncbi:MAG: hypothetical protein WC544_01035 [Patescibacteria group bacterium]